MADGVTLVQDEKERPVVCVIVVSTVEEACLLGVVEEVKVEVGVGVTDWVEEGVRVTDRMEEAVGVVELPAPPPSLPPPVEGTDKQMPAVRGVVLALAQQLQEVQPETRVAEEEQQQPPKHKLVPQSKGDEQVSPGEFR